MKKAISDYIFIEGKNKDDIKDIRDKLKMNSSMIFKSFNEYLLNMNDTKDKLNYYKDADVAEIFGKDIIATIKNWRRHVFWVKKLYICMNEFFNFFKE